MASIFPKADPKDKSVKRWMAKVKVGEEWKAYSLRLLCVPGTKREAQQRAIDLQNEIKAGLISESTKAWMGDEAAARLGMLVGRAGAKIPEGGSLTGWRAAYEGYLKATDAKDTRAIVEGKAKAEEKTKISRKYKLKIFVEWAEAQSVSFMKGPFTETIREYIEFRKSRGIQSSTLWSGDFTLLCCWGDWMAERKICEPINRNRIREVMPEKPTPVVKVPTWEADLDALRFFHGKRLADSAKGSDWKRNRTYFPAWLLVLAVRGLGCRPSEATALTWETVNLGDRPQVKFLKSKNNRARIVPIVFKWVYDGMVEAWELAGKPKTGPVCRKWDGQVWNWDVSAANLMQRVCEHHGRQVYHLKKAQKLHIAHMIRFGFPPHVVAYWTDHTLSVQEKHYYQGDGYLPPEDGWDYVEFGGLSAFGEQVRAHHGSYSKSLEIE